VADIHFVTRSGNFQFDLEAQGAIDQAGQVKAFGPLPSGFTDDVLPVIFSFDPRVLK
jgi:protein TonB